MSRSRAAATARRSTTHHGTRFDRRISGPMQPRPRAVPVQASTIALPAPPQHVAPRLPNPLPKIRAIPDHRLLDGLLRSNAWIWLIGLALGGIVAMQVSLLKLNAGISNAVESSATLERQNAELEIQVARLSSEDRIRAAALRAGLVAPDAGTVGFVTARGEHDVGAALRTMRRPGEGAAAANAQAAATIQPVVAAAPVAPVQQATAPAATTTTTTTQTAPATQTAPTTGGTTAAQPQQQTAPAGQQGQQASTAGGAAPPAN